MLALLAACGDDATPTPTASGEGAGEPEVRTVVQVANPEAQAPAGAAPTGWDTEWSQKVSFKLLSTFDSSGDPAWDVSEHPDVYFTTMGPGYSGIMSGENTLPGVAVFDAHTKELVAHRTYDLGAETYFEPHGMGVSMDGKYAYVPTGVSAGFGDVGTGRFLVIDTATLNLAQLISTPAAPHHAKAFVDSEGNGRVILYTFRGQGAVVDPSDDNRVVGSWDNGTLTGRGYLAFADPTGRYIMVSVRPPSGMDSDGGVAVIDTKSWRVVTNIGTHDSSPIWVEWSADGKTAFVSNGHHSNIAKIKTAGPPNTWELDRITQAGTGGPYGIRLNWDETQLWASGKGEGSHNRGQSIGLADPIRMPASWGTPGEWPTGCLRNDHSTLNPWDKSELWLSCNSSFETVVWDMDAKVVKDRIPMPLGASTHSGSFVGYTSAGDGAVLSDQNGLHGSALAEKAGIVAARIAADRAGTEVEPSEGTAEDALVTQGRTLYAETAGGVGCAFCHGADASGGIGPAIIGIEASTIAGALDRVAAMGFINLTDEEINAIAAYLVSIGPSGETE